MQQLTAQRTYNDETIKKWYRSDLNMEQRAAVQNIMLGAYHPAPYIVFGPPGTGKTSVLVEAALQVSSIPDLFKTNEIEKVSAGILHQIKLSQSCCLQDILPQTKLGLYLYLINECLPVAHKQGTCSEFSATAQLSVYTNTFSA